MIPTYRLIDSGHKKKLEQFGPYRIVRPCPQALWAVGDETLWNKPIDAEFVRTGEEKGVWNWNTETYYLPEKDRAYYSFIRAGNKQSHAQPVPINWSIRNNHNLLWHVEPNVFGNIGVFTEHWHYVDKVHALLKPKSTILNLFTYSGSNCVLLAQKGHKITAVDSSKNAMSTYTKNLELNSISRDGQRLILEDCIKFIDREIRRNSMYDCIMIDAPSFGRGTKGEVFKVEDDLVTLLQAAQKLIAPQGVIVTTLHSPRFTPKIVELLAQSLFDEHARISCEEIVVPCESGRGIPSGFLLIIEL